MNQEIESITYDLPPYIHTEFGRAFLVLSTDIKGEWTAGYTVWQDDPTHPNGGGRYVIIEPSINGGSSVEDVCKKLKEVRATT